MKKLLVIVAILPIFLNAQTAEEKRKIASFSNQEANAVLMQQLKVEEQQRLARLEQYLQAHPEVEKYQVSKDGQITELMDVLPNGEKIIAKTDNAGAAITARANKLYNGGSLGINIQGQGMTAGVWDGGSIRDTHREFVVNGTSKVELYDSASPFAAHATHVGGTIAAQGITANAKGVAFNSNLKSYDWTNDLVEMQAEAEAGLLLSNHSYMIGQLGSLWFYGAYDSRAKQFDQLCFNNPYYLPVVAAGNDRNSTVAPASTQIANKGGNDLIFGHGNSKNAITVAAVEQVNNYQNEGDVVMSSFSSWGPSDDGRIKPEISMKGVAVYSSVSSSDAAYGTMNGTSMATPGVTGVLTLLQQYHKQLYTNYLKAATLKGLVLHTADEAGYAPGPDYSFGWGLINAENSAKAIRDKNLTNSRSIIEERSLSNAAVFTKTITANGTGPLKVSISWTDPAYPTPNTGTVDPSTKYLVNDLDVKVTSSSGTVYYPWRLFGMSDYTNPAANDAQNNVDNYERVDIPNPSGTYTITVTHKGALLGGSQNYSLIVTSTNLSSLGTNEAALKGDEILLYPNPTQDFLYFKNNNLIEANVTVLDLSGRIVLQKVIKDGRLNVQNLNKSEYLLIYKDKKGKEFSEKFIKK
ncbi:S8 family serine peptidase [Amniculibacterium aquaticum]|uniref:S8 family serine peptidase n=1 Tax=Amniculibacterium aquaticum TaxID=2479858 RepID=UPI000F593A0F|nr:S8 family serine peptidase [Amniculibacterium aquaticum]